MITKKIQNMKNTYDKYPLEEYFFIQHNTIHFLFKSYDEMYSFIVVSDALYSRS